MKRAGRGKGETKPKAAAAVEAPGGQHWVFHRGALGDSVLLWPMLRQWRSRGLEVVLVCDGEKGRLAARELGIRAEDAESARFNAMWVAKAKVEAVEDVVGVVAYLGRSGEATQTWMANARRMFPKAAIAHRSERPSRPKALRYPLPERRGVAGGPVVLHVGAGAEEKRWDLARWVELAGHRKRLGGVKLIAGEVERERFSAAEREAFEGAGGEYLQKLEELAGVIRSARMVVCADSGPGHLAAQMGVPVVSLFGPGDPERWAPVGPVVEAVSPPRPRKMEWLSVERVVEGILAVDQRK